jgi:hypothetical protein
MNSGVLKNWKLKLRYGRMKTAFHHFTVLAEGEVVSPNKDFGTGLGPSFFGMKVWASDSDEAIDMVRAIGQHLGFASTGRIYVYDTDPTEPPGTEPHGYELKFTPYERD